MADYNILCFGALPDGKTNCAAAVQSAVDAANEAGGGRVVIPAGHFLSGTVLLKSNVELHLEAGAVFTSSLNEADIQPFPAAAEDDNKTTGWDGGFFLGARGAENVTLSGQGTIYGQGDKVFEDCGKDSGFHESPLHCSVFRPRLMLFENVTNFTVRGITLKDAAFWTLHMAGCRHVRIENILILNDDRGANNDGIDPDSCQDVVITGCIVKTGDDAIVVKSTKPMAKRYGACRNIVISNCVLHSRDSALKIGTETHGAIQNIVLNDCVVDNCSRGVGIWVRDGGTVEDIHVHHLTGAVRRYADNYDLPGAPGWWGKGEPVFISATPRNAQYPNPGKIRNISFDHLYLTAESCAFFAGEADCRVENVRLSDMDLTLEKQGTQPGGLFDEQPSVRHIYPHEIPALYARSIDGLTVRDCTVRFTGGAEAPWHAKRTAQLEDCRGAAVELTVRE